MFRSLIKTKLLYVILIGTAGIAITAASVNVVLAASITVSAAQPSSNFPNRAANYVVGFTTVTTGVIGKIIMIFPAGTTFPSGQVAIIQGVGVGTSSVVGSGGATPTLTYTITNPVQINSGTKIGILLQKFKNGPASGTVSIETQTSLGVNIDGPSTTLLGLGDNSLGTTVIVDDTSHFVGIGNNLTPQRTLDVGGNIGLSGNIVPNNNNPICIGTGC
ncbi:MAG: hypothetical protein ACREAD_01785 [Nitrosopumilaceae archaeon]